MFSRLRLTFVFLTALIEGDIVYDEQFKILTGQVGLRKRRDMLSDRGFHWKNAVVPYEIESDMCKYSYSSSIC